MKQKDRSKLGKQAAAKGAANENRLLAALLDRDFNASKVDLPHSLYDIVVELDSGVIIRIQAKTVNEGGGISFVGGSRGGVDREYKSGIKTYTQNTATSDIVVGVQSRKTNGDDKTDFYFVPTLLIEWLGQRSISSRKVNQGKNNWSLLQKCKEKRYVREVFADLLENNSSSLL